MATDGSLRRVKPEAMVDGFAAFGGRATNCSATRTGTTRLDSIQRQRLLNANVNKGRSYSKSRATIRDETENVGALSSIASWDVMKTYKNLYDKICSTDNLRKAFNKAKKGKSQKPYVKAFEADLENNIVRLNKELETLTYEPMPLKTFVLRDPKTRVISVSDFRDRVVHHALCNIIEPLFDKAFIHDSYASRIGKGTHAAIRRFDKFKRSVSCNGRPVKNAKDGNMITGYIMKADIKHYFASVDHQIMIQIIGKKIGDKKTLWLIRKILSNHDPKTPGKGMPIGNLTSQLFANIYLNELDKFVKHELRARYYIRYMDDFVFLDDSEEKLIEWKRRIGEFLETIRLELHAEKSSVFPLRKGVCFLGYRIFYHHKLLKKSNLRTLESSIRRSMSLYVANQKGREKMTQSLEGWMEYAGHANTYKLRTKIAKLFNSAFRERQA
jgi:retron-type reverse transcriptase